MEKTEKVEFRADSDYTGFTGKYQPDSDSICEITEN